MKWFLSMCAFAVGILFAIAGAIAEDKLTTEEVDQIINQALNAPITYEECFESRRCRILSHGIYLQPGETEEHEKRCPSWSWMSGNDEWTHPRYAWGVSVTKTYLADGLRALVTNNWWWSIRHYVQVFCEY